MDEVKYYPVEGWFWDCPKCNCYNEEEFGPYPFEELRCQNCKEEFKPVEG